MTKDDINDRISTKIKRLMAQPLFCYLFYSILVTVIDVIVVWILYRILHVDLIIANTIGVVTGFIIHYFLSAKAVFMTKRDLVSFLVYLATFLIGLLFADWLIFTGENYIFVGLNEHIRFLFSKGMSVVLPFFLLYFIRKYLFFLLASKKHRQN